MSIINRVWMLFGRPSHADRERLDFLIKLINESGGVVHLMNLNPTDYENRTPLDRRLIDAAMGYGKGKQ